MIVGEKEGSKTGSMICVIGGIVWLLIGTGVFVWVVYDLASVGFAGGDPDDRFSLLSRIGIGLYVSIVSIWVITAGVWMKKESSLKKGSFISLILGVLTANVIAIVGAIFGLREMNKKKVVQPRLKPIKNGSQALVSSQGKSNEKSQVKIISGGKNF
tara:strand:- start:2132 stop:2602 length:471 start_codon:yes stop_codon:yes gene_type:complete